MKIFIQTNKATAIIFGIYTQPRKTTHYTKKMKLVWDGVEKEKEPKRFSLANKKICLRIAFVSGFQINLQILASQNLPIVL